MADPVTQPQQPQQKDIQSPYVPPSRRENLLELAQALKSDGVISDVPADLKQESNTTVPPTPPPLSKSDHGKNQTESKGISADPPAIAKIAKAQAEFRKEREAAAPYMDALKVIPPSSAQALAKAVAAKDPVSVLASLGFTHADYVDKILSQKGQKSEAPQEAPKAKEVDPEIEDLRKFKREFEDLKAQAAQREVLAGVERTVKSMDKFKLVNALGEYGSVIRAIETYVQQSGGELPGSTFEESVSLAAELVEKQLSEQAAKWAKIQGLTPPADPPTVREAKAPESPPSAGSETHRTLTNSNTSAPAAVRPSLKTKEERLQWLIDHPDDPLPTP